MNSHDRLAQGLLAAVRAQDFGATPDPVDGGHTLRHFPSIDLAVVAFPASGAAVAANVLFSRDHPQGLVAPLPPDFGAQRWIAYLADRQRDDGVSEAWLPESDWSQLPFQALLGEGPRFVAPYPASLLKLMLAVGIARWVDLGHAQLDESWGHAGQRRPLRAWLFDMLAVSCNTATSALVALAHARGLLADERRQPHALHRLFAELGLPTLRFANTTADGGWGNAAGSGVGQIQMTAWDTVRLLWWLDPDASSCPWLPASVWQLQAASREALLAGLREQGLDIVLSSGALAGVAGYRPGIPNRLQAHWRRSDGCAQVGDYLFPAAPLQPAPEVSFLHKIGNTENYASDAGIVRGIAPWRRHYLVALQTNLGKRYAPQPACAGPWSLPALGALVDDLMKELLE
jgi:hypothetical protein